MANITVLLKELSSLTSKDEAPELLTAERLHQLWLMSASQLEIIYKRGKRKVRIDDSEEAYHQLWLMSEDQLEAIFGSDRI